MTLLSLVSAYPVSELTATTSASALNDHNYSVTSSPRTLTLRNIQLQAKMKLYKWRCYNLARQKKSIQTKRTLLLDELTKMKLLNAEATKQLAKYKGKLIVCEFQNFFKTTLSVASPLSCGTCLSVVTKAFCIHSAETVRDRPTMVT